MAASILDSSFNIDKEDVAVCFIEMEGKNLLLLEHHDESDSTYIDVIQVPVISKVDESLNNHISFGKEIEQTIFIDRVDMADCTKKQLFNCLQINGAATTTWLCPESQISKLYSILGYQAQQKIKPEHLLITPKDIKYVLHVFLEYLGIALPPKLISETRIMERPIKHMFFSTTADSADSQKDIVLKDKHIEAEKLLMDKIMERDRKLFHEQNKSIPDQAIPQTNLTC